MSTATIQKNKIFLAGLDFHVISVIEPEVQLVDGAPGNGHEPLFRTLAENSDIAIVEEQVRQFQRDEFTDAQAARKQHFDDGAVAVSLPFRQVDARLDLVDFRRREHFWQVFAQVWRLQKFRRVVFDEAVEQQKAVERADAAQNPHLRRRSDAHFVQRGSEMLQVVQLDAEQVLPLAPTIVLQVEKVVLIRFERVRRVVALKFQVAHILLDDIFFRFLVLFHENRGFSGAKLRKIEGRTKIFVFFIHINQNFCTFAPDMLFNSFEFLIFLPIVFSLYWFVFRGRKWQNLLVVIASYVFYGWWDWRFLFLIALTSFFSFGSGLLIERYEGKRRWQRAVSAANIVLNLGILGIFKYYNFFVENLDALFSALGWHLDWVTMQIILPVGISFYTFQALSYTIDVYQRKLPATHDIVEFFAYISFFPQLVAGPIERATNLLPQFQQQRHFDYAKAVDGMRQMLWGF